MSPKENTPVKKRQARDPTQAQGGGQFQPGDQITEGLIDAMKDLTN